MVVGIADILQWKGCLGLSVGPVRFASMFDGSLPEDRLGVLVAAEVNLRARRDADVELLRLALSWADLHPDESLPAPVDDIEARRRRLADLVGLRMGGEGTPLVLGHCPSELGVVLETTYTGAKHLIADALDLRQRLPRLWKTVQAGGVAAWKARRVAAATRTHTIAQAAEVDSVVHQVIASLGWSRFEAILDATIKQADPDSARAAEQDAATRRFVAVGRANDHHIRTLIARGTSLDILSFMVAVNRIAELLGDEGDPDPVDVRRSKAVGILARPACPRSPPRTLEPPVVTPGLADRLGRSDASVTLQPVVLPDPPPVDSYEIPQAIRDALAARHLGSVYPWSNATGPAVDLDHTTAYVPLEEGGPPGQTGVGTLGPLARREHRHKTFGHLKVRQPAPGVYFWRSRHGWVWLVTNTGTHSLGRGPRADAFWQAAAPRAEPPSPRKGPGPKAKQQPHYRIDIVHPSAKGQLILRT